MKKEMHNHENHEDRRAWRREHFEQEDMNGKLIISLRDLSHAMRGLYEGRGSQKRILIVLSEAGTVTQRELTQRLGIQPGSASEVVAKLEGAGLITRTESEEDRRTVDISLTEEGVRQAQEAKSQRAGRHEEMFSALTEEEKSHLLELLEKLNADWEVRYGGHTHHRHEHRQDCNHDCANCPHPCGRAQRR